MSDPWTDADEAERLYETKIANLAKLAETLSTVGSKGASGKLDRPFARRRLNQVSPKRIPGGFYRTADGKTNALGGVPLVKMEDAVTAAVRMAYKVAAAQVERSSRLAKRLREAGDRAVGPDSDRKALDATERLVFRSMMSGLSWLETAAAERDSPLKRLLAAEYRLLGSMLGFGLSDVREQKDEPAAAEEDVPTRWASRTANEAPAASTRFARDVKIVHKGKGAARPVRITELDMGGLSSPGVPLVFYSVKSVRSRPISGELVVQGKRDVTLYLSIPRSAAAGRWQAAICDVNKRQLGFIEILL